MALTLRTGRYGDYYGNDFYSSNPLNQTQMEVNVNYIYSYLHNSGWSDNAIAGILGNMQVESSFNPGRWQSADVGNTSMGYGLVQWTPSTNYTNWVQGDPSEMDNNLSRIIYEIDNGLQWIPRLDYSSMSFVDFSTSSLPPSTLAKAFMLCYERPANQSFDAQNARGANGDYWYTFITGLEPTDPTTRNRKHKYKFILFNRRLKNGQR